ncbi:WD repeat-containing protein CG11141 [Teleopsis dalmanni]|uniref:WD repeat-containing protein CG11141 n=1 Tax=Teleopsis dalmanni TaxID=139649 RepID=UPI0018CCFDB3|nr:WD repeat-containing protein CG11141 [Teleopsis dalmanni]XP_037951675.1 WD repeat-containing protein CG11141 [Teleopsis dalmanni]
MCSKELYAIREWAPLTDLIERIPSRTQRGFLSVDVNITCIDAVNEFIALGSDVGIVFWYNRFTGNVQKLKAEVATRITCVKIVNSVEFMVAAGNSTGQVSVFQIQKELPPDLNLVGPCARPKPIERYTIRDLHRSAVSCNEWSKNGMKLYSGDRLGVVVLTEFDYQAHISKSVEILSEAYEIVQMNVYQSYLLVSTLYRSIICQRCTSSGQWQITQVGKKDRKQLVDCGGVFLKTGGKSLSLICGRPGLRFWLADTDGNVEKTYLFKEAIHCNPTWVIPILNPKQDIYRSTQHESNVSDSVRNFGVMYPYIGTDTLIVTHDEINLYILNLDRLCVEAVAKGFRKILDFCVCDNEIFVLEGERSVLRLAPMPEKPNKTAKIIFNPLMPPPVPVLGSAICGTFESPVEYEPDEQSIIKAEECFELSPIEPNKYIPIELAVESPRAEQNRRLEIFNQISQMDFDQSILHHSGVFVNGRKKRKSRDNSVPSKAEGIVEIGQVADVKLAQNEKADDEHVQNRDSDKNEETNRKSFAAKMDKSNASEFTAKPTLMDVSYCLPESLKSDQETQTFGLGSPAGIERSDELKTFSEELKLSDNLYINENMNISQVLSSSIKELKHAYPRQSKVEDAGVQTSPNKKFYYVPDFSTGQPVDDIIQTLRETNLAEDFPNTNTTSNDEVCAPTLEEELLGAVGGISSRQASNSVEKQFVHMPPVNTEIDSFLLDFSRARDPLQKNTPPPSAESNTSSDWEFLDN